MNFTVNYKACLLTLSVFSVLLLSGCNSVKKDATIGDLKSAPTDYRHVDDVTPARKYAIENYQSYIDTAEFKTHYAEALRRVADLELETSEENKEKADDEHKRDAILMLSSIEHYNTYLKTYPGHEENDLILYQLAKAYSLTGDIDRSKSMLDEIVSKYSSSRYIDEVQFRRGEMLFVWREYQQAEQAYASIVTRNNKSPLYEKALYKLGWAQFKQSNYNQSIKTYLSLMDIKEQENKITQYGIDEAVSKSEREFITDSLRVISLSLSYQNGYKTIEQIFKGLDVKLYEPLVYQQLGELYVKKERFQDAADTYMAFTEVYPQNQRAPEFHMYALAAYTDGAINHQIVPGKILYVNNYGVGSPFFMQQADEAKRKIQANLIKHIRELAYHFHANARQSTKLQDYKQAAIWYKKYLTSFPASEAAAHMNFLLAESLFEAKNYNEALLEYEKTAYQYPAHEESAEAAYAALLTYNKMLSLVKPADKVRLELQALNGAIRFSNTFPQDKHAPAVITKTAEILLESKNYLLASDFSQRIINNATIKDISLMRTSRLVYAHAQFELKQYAIAEQAYASAILLIPKKTKYDIKLRNELSEKLAASIYKQGENVKAKGESQLAVRHFLRLGKAVPASSIRFTAEYDAATLYIEMKEWPNVINLLEKLRLTYPRKTSYAQGISSKLALAFTQAGQFNKAAKEINTLSAMAANPEERRVLIWESAEMYEKANDKKHALEQYQKYVSKYPKPFVQSIEGYHRIAEHYKTSKTSKTYSRWLKKLVKAEKKGANERTERSRYLAAAAAFELAEPEIAHYKAAKLKRPLKKNLKIKKTRMKAAIGAYKNVMKYKVADFATASTYYMGDIYQHLAESLMSSQRPKGLSADELEQYDILLEEQAYPFEEKAINIHLSNIKRTQQGIYDKWVKKSMQVLAGIEPIRYAKPEKMEPYVLITH